MHHPSMSWHIIPLKFSNWNIICFGLEEPINVQFFRLLSSLMKICLIPHAIFEITKLEFIQILHHCSVSWKVSPLYFFLSQSLYTFDKKSTLNWSFQTFESLGENWTNSLCQIPCEIASQFFFKLCITLQCHGR